MALDHYIFVSCYIPPQIKLLSASHIGCTAWSILIKKEKRWKAGTGVHPCCSRSTNLPQIASDTHVNEISVIISKIKWFAWQGGKKGLGCNSIDIKKIKILESYNQQTIINFEINKNSGRHFFIYFPFYFSSELSHIKNRQGILFWLKFGCKRDLTDNSESQQTWGAEFRLSFLPPD